MQSIAARQQLVLRSSAVRARLQKGRSVVVVPATSTRHGLQYALGHGFGLGAPDRHLNQHYEADRSAKMNMHLQQGQHVQADQFNQNLGLNSPAHKPAQHLADSHTCPANSRLAAYGCYRVVGPARISKRGDTLVAYLFRGSRVELLDHDGNAMPYGSSAGSMAEEELLSSDGTLRGSDAECCVGECVLVAAHVELCGSACSVDLVDISMQPAVHHHNGHTYVSVRSLPPDSVFELDADADLRHPINVTPAA